VDWGGDRAREHIDQVVDDHTDLADATAALEDTLDTAGFGGPAVVDPATGTPQPFVDSLSLDAWRAYRDVLRQHLIDT
jgi:hypothetical protein